VQYRSLGRGGPRVSEVGLGCNNFGLRIDEAAADAVVGSALDQGVTLLDTADVYGPSEDILGRVLSGGRRHQVVLATKFGAPMPGGANFKGGSRSYVIRAVERSLKRLQTDYIDLYQIHMPDPETPIEETLGALHDLVKAGKVRSIGSSNFTGWRIADADWSARDARLTRFVSAQNNFSLLERGAEDDVIPACERFGLGLLPFFPLASGLLSGKYVRGQPPAEGTRLAAWGPQFAASLNDQNFDRIDALTAWAAARGHAILELAFAWLLGHPAVSSVIAGATSPAQVSANVAAAAWRLSPEEVEEVSALAGADHLTDAMG
jgi:aryl-alcohol dehydrogenase-like predicted oxidoreductase